MSTWMMIHVCETSLHLRVCLQEVKLSLPVLIIDYSVQFWYRAAQL